MPAGRVSGRDEVVTFNHGNVASIIENDINIGDTFVYEATLRLLDFSELVTLPTSARETERAIDLMDSCDFAILRGSNYIHNEMDWGNLPRIVERSQVPVVAFGIGAQAPRYEDVPVSAETRRLLQVISERSHSIGCRGAFSAEVLGKLGIRNAVPIGCPSIFRANDRALQVRVPAPEAIRRVAFTVARGMSGMYCESPGRARVQQLALMEALQRRYDVYPVTQSERAEKLFYYRCYDQLDEARALMKESGWNIQAMPWLETLYRTNIFFGTSPAQYEGIMRYCDAAVGYRLHGNIMALAVGKPAIYQTFDSRTRELVAHFAIPSHDIMSDAAFDCDLAMSADAFAGFNRRLPEAYDLMRDYLDANGVPHRMTRTGGNPSF